MFALPMSGIGAALQLTGRVMDHAGVLSAQTVSNLTAELAAHEEQTSNQVVVLTLAGLDGYAVEQRALDLARGWQLGQAGRDNGVLFLVAMAERKIRIEVGYGLEGALPDAIAANIIRHHVQPRFRAGDFDGGVARGVTAILAAIRGEYQPEERREDDGVPNLWFWIIVIFILIQFLRPLFFGNVGSTRSRGGRYYGGSWGGRGGGFGGGGGFSGGGGGFGGGGASGGW